MALVNRTLRISFQSFYQGQHRVCYRVAGSGSPYICTNTSTSPYCAGNNTPCQYDITIQVDDETCNNVTYEGYVQAMCEPFDSLFGRVPFSVTFVPQPACNRWRFTCERGGIASLAITEAGSGYLSAPTVTVNSLTGSGAIITANIAGGAVTGFTIVDAGEGYLLTDTITISSPSSGVTALASISSLEKCAELPLYDCAGPTGNDAFPTVQGDFISMCSDGEPAAPNINWTMTQETIPCICSCANYTIQANVEDTDLLYYDCDSNSYTQVLVEAGDSVTACMSENSWSWYNASGTPPTITNNGACS